VDRPTLVCIGHGDCETTRLLLPFVDRIHRRAPPGRDVVAVLQDTPEDARAVLAELGLGLPVLLDPEPWALGSALGLTTVPVTLVIEPGGAVTHLWQAFRRTDVERAAELFDVPAP
jgi:peroxiredoxin